MDSFFVDFSDRKQLSFTRFGSKSFEKETTSLILNIIDAQLYEIKKQCDHYDLIDNYRQNEFY